MKKLLASTAFAALMLSGAPAFADCIGTGCNAPTGTGSATGTVTVGGTVATCCTWLSGTGNTSINIPNFVDSAAHVTPSNTVTQTLGTVNCTGPAYVRVRSASGGLKNGSVSTANCSSTGDATCVNYAAVATWNAGLAGTPTANMPTTNGVANIHADSPSSTTVAGTGNVVLALTPLVPAGNPALNAGTFSDVTTVIVANPL